jgi:hypothetical protein
MEHSSLKQPALKPQDLVVALKICVRAEEGLSFSALAQQLFMSASEVHAAVGRAATSHLLTRDQGVLVPNRASIREFLIHGAKYAFPIVVGAPGRGLPTGSSAPPLNHHFQQLDALPLVWPDADGIVRGIAIRPLYPSVPMACKNDDKLYRLLTVVDALRGGAAREREIAKECLAGVLR